MFASLRRPPLSGHTPLASLRLLAAPFALRKGRASPHQFSLVSFRACWMVWRMPSRLVVTSLFQKRMTR